MSLYPSPDFPFTSFSLDFSDDKYAQTTLESLSLPSPPSTITSSSDSGLDFDLDSFTHCSPAPIIPAVALSPITSSTPTSTLLVSPRSSIGDLSFSSLPIIATATATSAPSDSDAAEALSNHHLQRYLHYKALAAQAEAESRAASAQAQLQSEQFGALLASCDFSMPGDTRGNQQVDNINQSTGILSTGSNNMLAYHPQQAPPPPYYGVPSGSSSWMQPFTYHPQQDQAALHRAQAAAHIQAHDAALRVANQQAQQRQDERFHNFYMPLDAARPSFDVSQEAGSWSRDSGVTTISGATTSYPSTPVYSVDQTVGLGLPIPSLPLSRSVSGPSSSTTIPSFRPLRSTEGEPELENDEDDDEDELTQYESGRQSEDQDIKPVLDVNGMPIPNLHGGGRGYVPGKTPDDPKKRHKCRVCGRGFARAFNLKSHAQTHNPTRPKPFQCPHATCKRGFSRLHDLERHRQGIHSDGPLVDAKRHGVPPAVARAQGRIQRRAERGALI